MLDLFGIGLLVIVAGVAGFCLGHAIAAMVKVWG